MHCYEPLGSLPFYSLDEFRKLELLSNSRFPVHLCQHLETNERLVVKEAPYHQDSEKIYSHLCEKPSSSSVVIIRGVALVRSKPKSKRKHDFYHYEPGRHLDTQKTHNASLLVFMEPCQCNLQQYVEQRLKERKPFNQEEVTEFLRQILLVLLELEDNNISHRDIKPSNILYDHGRYRLCDFDSAMYLDPLVPLEKREEVDITTFAYASPELFKNLKQRKKKLFDAHKLDVYALGLTLLYVCSVGRFCLKERENYLKGELFHNVHTHYIKEQRRKFIKNNEKLKPFNSIVKMMLEGDEYKRDTFLTLTHKVRTLMVTADPSPPFEKISEHSKSEESLHHKHKQNKHRQSWPGSTKLQRKSMYSFICLSLLFFVLLFII